MTRASSKFYRQKKMILLLFVLFSTLAFTPIPTENGYDIGDVVTDFKLENIDGINNLGVPCYWGSCSEVYLEKAFDETDYRPEKRLINAKKLGEDSLMFLVHPNLTDYEIQKTCDSIIAVMKEAGN